jgi:hypothetical protein
MLDDLETVTNVQPKQRKSSESTSPATVGTPDLSHTPITSTPSPPIVTSGAEYFPYTLVDSFPVIKQEVCSDCQIFLCRPGQSLCPRCCLLQPTAPADDVDNRLFDPFGTTSIEMNNTVSELLDHCKYSVPACYKENARLAAPRLRNIASFGPRVAIVQS